MSWLPIEKLTTEERERQYKVLTKERLHFMVSIINK